MAYSAAKGVTCHRVICHPKPWWSARFFITLSLYMYIIK